MSGIIGTGGHIDHGKTALVAALTGEDTDRLPEEKRRGISIDLGFSRLVLGGKTHGIVDVPGHEDFIRNMLAGASGIDVLLLVVAADEGVMPQTREHVAIAEVLEVPRAVVALTKSDLVEDEWLALVQDDVAEFLGETRYADAPLLPVSSRTGIGLGPLRSALEAALGSPRREPEDLLRIPVDRAFTIRGTGTVVTGTVWSGVLAGDGAVRVEPGGLEARVRGLQVHGEPVPEVRAGQRAAIALAGVEKDQVPRGVTITGALPWTPSSIVTARIRILPGSDWSIRQRQRIRVHLGTAEALARVRLLEEEELGPGAEGWAQLRLEDPLVARTGDRCVLRSYSPVTTIGGAIVAEPRGPKRKRMRPGLAASLADRIAGSPERALAAVLRDAAGDGVAVEDLPVLIAAPPERLGSLLDAAGATVAGGRAFDPDAAAEVEQALLEAVEEHHRRWPLRTGIEREEFRRAAAAAPELVRSVTDRLLEESTIESRDGRIGRSGWQPVAEGDAADRVAAVRAILQAAGTTPPSADAVEKAAGQGADPAEEILRYMEARRLAIRIQPGVWMDPDVVDRIIAAVRRELAGRTGLGPADFRDIVDVSRKHLIPILEYLDLAGVTVRHGEGRSVPPAGPGPGV